MNKIAVRAATGAVYVTVIVAMLMIGGALGFTALCALFGVLGVLELDKISNPRSSWVVAALVDIVMVLTLIWAPLYYVWAAPMVGASVALLLILATIATMFIVRLIVQLYGPVEQALGTLSHSFLSIFYLGIPLAIAAMLDIIAGPAYLLAMFIMIWLNDTGAFLVGSAIGRHRLFERVSPKKSWEGFWGGFAFAIGGGIFIYYLFGSWAPTLSLVEMIFMGAIVSLSATWGDLVESIMKRSAHVKDSGNLLPGHGGILDRIDSLLVVAPSLLIFFVILLF